MREVELWPDLEGFISKHFEYLMFGAGLSSEHKLSAVDCQQFRNKFFDVLKQNKIVDDPLDAEPVAVIGELRKFSSSKIRNELLREYRSLCVALRVVGLYAAYPGFFLAPFDHKDLLDEIFDNVPEFQQLNEKFSQVFHNEDKRTKKSGASCKGYYYCAMKGIDYVEQRKVKPTGIEVGNFTELSHFFLEHPLICDFVDKQLPKIRIFAEIFKENTVGKVKNQSPDELKCSPEMNKKRKREEAEHLKTEGLNSRFRNRLVCSAKTPVCNKDVTQVDSNRLG